MIVKKICLVVMLCFSLFSDGLLAQAQLSRADFDPVYKDKRALEALRLLNEGKAGEALELLRALVYGKARPSHLERLRFLLAVAAVQAKAFEAAITALEGLEGFVPDLRDHILFLRGRSLAALGQHKEAISCLEQVQPESAVAIRARLVLGDSLAVLGRYEAAAQAYRFVFERGRKDPEVAQKLAGALAASGKKDEAQALLRTLYFTTIAAGKRAYGEALKALGFSLAPTEQDKADEAMALLEAHANRDALEAAQALEKSSDLVVRCKAMWIKARALSKMRKHSEALPVYQKVLRECEGSLDLPQVLYHSTRSALRSGNLETARELAHTMRQRFPNSTLNDDIAIWLARVAINSGDVAQGEQLLRDSLRMWPDGDMALEAAWLLAWAAYRRSEWSAAIALLDQAIALAKKRGDSDYGSRFMYWKGRSLAHLGKKKAAREAYEACVRDYPMTFYAHLALNRLAGNRPLERTFAGIQKKSRPGPFFTPSNPNSLKRGPLARAFWLLGTGLQDWALEELARADTSDPDIAWVRAIILDMAGDTRQAHKIAARLLKQAEGFWPDELTKDYYYIAYPRPFEKEVLFAAKESHVDPLLLWALMREESAFNPAAESHANAIGLLQLIVPTAKEMAKHLKIRITPESLRNPDINVRLGAAYIARLLKRFGNPLLAIPGYNAGGGAITSWLKANPGVQLDVFVEEISAEETRNYARKVFESFAAYHYLYGNERFIRVHFER